MGTPKVWRARAPTVGRSPAINFWRKLSEKKKRRAERQSVSQKTTQTTESNDPEKSCFGCFLAFSWNFPRFRGVKVFLAFRCIWHSLVGPRLSSPSGTLSVATLDVVKAVGIVWFGIATFLRSWQTKIFASKSAYLDGFLFPQLNLSSNQALIPSNGRSRPLKKVVSCWALDFFFMVSYFSPEVDMLYNRWSWLWWLHDVDPAGINDASLSTKSNLVLVAHCWSLELL